MGIKNLSSTLRKRLAPSVFRSGHISAFAGQKVAIDSMAFIFKYHTAAGDRWWRCMVQFILSFRRHNVHPVFVFDSARRPAEKSDTILARKEASAKRVSKRDNLEEAFAAYQSDGTVTEPLQKYTIANTGSDAERILLGEGASDVVDVTLVAHDLDKLRNQTRGFSNDVIFLIQAFLDVAGIPYITASYEADPLCAKLCEEGVVSAALSPDSDLFAYGCPTIITSYTPKDGTICVVDLNEVLEELDFTRETFVDFCIMCGTDNNNNIPGVGPMTAFKLLTEHGSIDDIPRDTSSLTHERMREIFFGCYEEGNEYRVPWSWCDDIEAVESFLTDNDCAIGIRTLTRALGPREVTLG